MIWRPPEGEFELCPHPKCKHPIAVHFRRGEPNPENRNCKRGGCKCPIDYSKNGFGALTSLRRGMDDS